MDPIQATLISKGKNGRAQVVTHRGEGRQKRSVTRHVRFAKGVWMGRNPDDAAVARLDATENKLGNMQRFHERRVAPLTEVTMEEIERVVDKVNRYREKTFRKGMNPDLLDIAMEMLRAGLPLNAGAVKKALDEVIASSARAIGVVLAEVEHLRIEVPREVEFEF